MNANDLEIERKYLLRDMPGDLDESSGAAIRQGYLCDAGDSSVRIRQKSDVYYLTCKRGAGVVRQETEIEITAEQFEALWPATFDARVCKTRFRYALTDGLVAEIDVFEQAHAPLRVVEVEFPDAETADAFEPLSFFGPEVTTDPRFLNAALARDGLPVGWEKMLEFNLKAK